MPSEPRATTARAVRIAALLAAIALAAWSARGLRVRAMQRYLDTQRYEDVYYLPRPELLRVFSLGFHEALADMLWLKALLYYADELQHRGEVAHVYHYADALLSLDPYFRAVYRWVATAALYRTGTITAKDAQRVVAFLERGVRLFPEDGELAWELGATYQYELAPLLEDDPAAQAEARRRGIAHLEAAVRLGAGPPWLVLNNASQLEKLGKAEQAIRHLEEMYASVRDEGVREEIAVRLTRLRSAAYAEAFRQVHEDLERKRQRDFPYMSQTLYLLVGERPPLDGWMLRARRFDPVEPRFGDD